MDEVLVEWLSLDGIEVLLCAQQFVETVNKVSAEYWDDGIQNDGKGCLPDWSGVAKGWYWSGGDLTQPDSCTEKWGDGFVTTSEKCDDGNASDGIGWLSDCSGVIDGYNWQFDSITGRSVWVSIWGDNFKVSNEEWDDWNNIDNDGWTNWKINNGWAWSNVIVSGKVKR